jgi:carnitine 3-dehydrogenase
MNQKARVLCAGAGTIGRGWAVLFLQHGWQVDLWDPDPQARKQAPALIATTLRSLVGENVVVDLLAKLQVVATLSPAAAKADYVQESAPESVSIKKELITELLQLTRINVIIGSSTSALSLDEITAELGDGAQRCIVVHPVNPVYLVPLVELVSGRATSEATVTQVTALMRSLKKTPIRLRKHITGFVLNRLQETLWREALHLAASGVASIEDIDLAVTQGLGPRWAVLGPFGVYHLAYGEGGIAAMLAETAGEHPGWSRLPGPELSTDCRSEIIATCNARTQGQSVSKNETRRDQLLQQIIELKQGIGNSGE